MAVLPEVTTPTEEVTIVEIQVGDPGIPLSDDQKKLRLLIWESRHLLMER